MTLFPGSIYGGLAQLGASAKVAAAAVPWYLSGGVAAANCLAAYQPKGAADYATSKVNLANPGTYNAADGTAYPTWAAATGWTGNGATNARYLTTGITIAAGFSIIAAFSGIPATGAFVICGHFSSSNPQRYLLEPYFTGNKIATQYGDVQTIVDGGATSGVIATTPSAGYFNGSPVSSFTGAAWTGTTSSVFPIMARRIGTGYDSYFNGNVLAIAFYNTTLTAPQVAAISTAMAAL